MFFTKLKHCYNPLLNLQKTTLLLQPCVTGTMKSLNKSLVHTSPLENFQPTQRSSTRNSRKSLWTESYLFRSPAHKSNSSRGFSNKTSDGDIAELDELKEMFKDDPDVKKWLKQLSEDFGHNSLNKPIPSDAPTEVKDSSSESSSDSGTDSESDYDSIVKTQGVDVDKEMQRYNIEEFYGIEDEEVIVEEQEQRFPISLDRGKTGVFDVEEIVELLRSENGSDICVISIPEELDYADYLVIVTGRSLRHLKGMAQYTKWLYKRKRNEGDKRSCRIEGLNSNDWLAIDLQNIVVHFMLAQTRELYDLETLWTVGAKYDDKMAEEEDPFVKMFEGDFLDMNEQSLKTDENVLTLSDKAEYVYEKEEKTNVEHKFMNKHQEKVDSMGMENVAGWHSFEGKEPSRKGQ